MTSRKINEKEHEHVLNVWNKFEMKTRKDHHDLYLKCDVLFLADVFEKFRDNSLKNYGLCPNYYMRASGLRWDTILKMTKVELELIRKKRKEKYVLHYEETRIINKKIHRILEFNQSQLLEPYTEFNTQKRIQAKKIETKMEKHLEKQ